MQVCVEAGRRNKKEEEVEDEEGICAASLDL